jgi:hypothetical protein
MASPREQTAHALADTCVCAGLNDSYGVLTSKVEADKSYWAVTFCKARILDGEIRVYSPRFILVKWQTAIRDMPAKGSIRFTDEYEAKKWIVDKFVMH